MDEQATVGTAGNAASGCATSAGCAGPAGEHVDHLEGCNSWVVNENQHSCQHICVPSDYPQDWMDVLRVKVMTSVGEKTMEKEAWRCQGSRWCAMGM